MTLDGVLAAESAGVSGVLCDFHLLDLLSKRGTISERRRVKRLALSFPTAFMSWWTQAACDRFLRNTQLQRAVAYLVPYLPVTPTSVKIVSGVEISVAVQDNLLFVRFVILAEIYRIR